MKMNEQVSDTQAIILNNQLFRSKPQMQRLLTYLVEHTYFDHEPALQQRRIAIDCLGRGQNFDPAKDPIVRIEAARLRKLLDRVYEQESINPPPYRISLPKGSYRLSFSRALEQKLSTGLGLLLVCQSPQSASERALQLMLRVRHDLSIRLAQFRHLEFTADFSAEHQVAERGAIHFLTEEQHDYVLRIEVVEGLGEDYLLSSIAVHRLTQEILWSQSSVLKGDYDALELEDFYKGLISPLVADAYGLLGKHWSTTLLQGGVEYVPDHQISYVYYIAICNEPSLALCQQFLSFLDARLERYPDDYVARAGYLALGFFDYFLDYGLIQDDLKQRLYHALEAGKYYPSDDGFSILIGFCYFLMDDYKQARVYLEAAKELNSSNTLWDFIYGSLRYFMGDEEQGLQVLQELKKYNQSPPGYYAIPEFFHYLGQGSHLKAFITGSRVSFADNLEYLVKALAFLCVGAEVQASQEFAKMTAPDAQKGSWVVKRVLKNHPVLADKVAKLLVQLREIA